jgi:hypothetical protein
MDYNTIDVDAEVNAMVETVERREARPASKWESMAVRWRRLVKLSARCRWSSKPIRT